jgi:hypothetical protein
MMEGIIGPQPSKASTDAGVLWKGRVGPGEAEEEVAACVPARQTWSISALATVITQQRSMIQMFPPNNQNPHPLRAHMLPTCGGNHSFPSVLPSFRPATRLRNAEFQVGAIPLFH